MSTVNVHWFKLESLKTLLESGDLYTLDDGKYVKLEYSNILLHAGIDGENLYADKSKVCIEE